MVAGALPAMVVVGFWFGVLRFGLLIEGVIKEIPNGGGSCMGSGQ